MRREVDVPCGVVEQGENLVVIAVFPVVTSSKTVTCCSLGLALSTSVHRERVGNSMLPDALESLADGIP